jgi:YVTN family beta-propeller protein
MTAYVVNEGSDTVTPITIATNAPRPPIPVGSEPDAIAITPAPAGPIISGYRTTRCADDSHDSSADGTPIVLWHCNGTAAQNWTIEADHSIQINGKCMDARHGSTPGSPPVRLRTCNRRAQPAMGAAQRRPGQLGIRRVPDRSAIQHRRWPPLQVRACDGSPDQQWKLP